MTEEEIRGRLFRLQSQLAGTIGETANRMLFNRCTVVPADLDIMTKRIHELVREVVEEIYKGRGLTPP